MGLEYCYPLKEGEILNEDKDYPLFEVTIHGSDVERVKLSKRLVCAVKHLPLRLKIHYEKDPLKSIEIGVAKDPTLTLNDKILLEGLVSSEEITKTFENLLEEKK
ncbi:hypothetical protein [Nitrosophilus kaiyonis]|uniref:hypothetical protein n=1 Tax=Nitrosophilus kaiyonis TaxID=2930200 RepID=UPI0024924C72|nr:hypothetical protein [Nitrosophilus kaiyonis]